MERRPELEKWPPKMVVCVGTVVLKGKSVLLVRQAEGHPLAKQWSIPWGVVDPGESPEIAAIRETKEESGISATIEGTLGFQNLRQPGWIGIVFLCRHASGKPSSDGGAETDKVAYFSLKELDGFSKPIEPWCEWLVQRVLSGDIPLSLLMQTILTPLILLSCKHTAPVA